MKKIYRYITILAMSSMALLSSCSKNGSDSVTPFSAESTVALNQNTKTFGVDTLFVRRDKLTAALQVSAVSNIDMKRIYVYKKSSDTTASLGSYQTYAGSGFTQDASNHYYYSIPNDQKNNVILNLTVTLNANNSAAVSDEYYFVFTDGSAYSNPGTSSAGLLLGPAQIFITYGILTETTGYRLYNIQGPDSSAGAFDLSALINKARKDIAINKDMIDSDSTTALWEKSFSAGTSKTLYVQLSAGFDYTHATDLSIKNAYMTGTAASTEVNVATGNMYVAKLRGLNQYVLIKVTYISNESGLTGTGNDNEYMEFSVKK